MSHLAHVRCVLAVADLSASTAFYRDRLGLKLDFEADGWSFMSRDSFSLMIGHCPDDAPAKQTGSHSWFAYVNVTAIENLYAEYRDKGVRVIEALDAKPWGMKEFVIETPDGHRIKFGQEQ